MTTHPTPEKYWLKEHQVTAFWHGFGISNGLRVPKEAVKVVRYAKGTPREVYEISAEHMHGVLMDYIKWLKSYKENWEGENTDYEVQNRAQFMESQSPKRLDIVEMIELLQECRINDK